MKLDAFANHGVDPGSQRTRRLCGLVRIEINIFGTLVVFFQRISQPISVPGNRGQPDGRCERAEIAIFTKKNILRTENK